jgi:hypothetical protein
MSLKNLSLLFGGKEEEPKKDNTLLYIALAVIGYLIIKKCRGSRQQQVGSPKSLDAPKAPRTETSRLPPLPLTLKPAARPEAARPPAARPPAARPEAARPEAARPPAARPEAARPPAARPEAARPEAARPAIPEAVRTK